MPDMPRITLVGRPNVGKSTLFNRLVGSHTAITSSEAGTTRDYVERAVSFGRGAKACLTDAGGYQGISAKGMQASIQRQLGMALQESSGIIFVVDASSPLTRDDYEAATFVRKQGLPFLFIANKCDTPNTDALLPFLELGLGTPLAVSALHMLGLEQFTKTLATFTRTLPAHSSPPPEKVDATCVLIGRTNVGKSTLLNAFARRPRVLTAETATTTRDTTDIFITHEQNTIRCIDTAGLRRPGVIGRGIDRFATGRTLNAISESDVAVLVIDGSEPRVTSRDLTIAEKAIDCGCSLVIAITKSDILSRPRSAVLADLAARFHFARWCPAVFVSGKNAAGLAPLFQQIITVAATRSARMPTRQLNLFITRQLMDHPNPAPILYATQVAVRPPTFSFFLRKKTVVQHSFKRFLENRIREEMNLAGTPLTFQFVVGTEKDRARGKARSARPTKNVRQKK